jgi:hypothetical protein
MSRKLRIEYPGAMYHVMNRGDQREDIFRDDHDRQKFLATLGEACVKTEWQLGKELERLGWDEVQLRARPTFPTCSMNPQKRTLKLRRCYRCVNSED